MAKKPTISTVSSGFLSRDQVNTNFTNIRDAFDNTLSLDGSTPNTVAASIDMNANDVINVGGISAVGGAVFEVADLITVGGISADVTTVAGISADVTIVAADEIDIGVVSTNIADVIAVAADATDIGVVSTDIANVNTVAGSITNVNAVATNIADVNNFAETYRISATEPATSLDAGDLYFNTATNTLSMYNGATWQPATIGALVNVVEDTTPQLGGTLDMNGNAIDDTNFTGSITEQVFTLTGTAVALDPANGTYQEHTLSGTTTYTDSLATGQSITLHIPGTANTITWPTIKWLGGAAPTLDAVNNNLVVVFKIGSILFGSSMGVYS